MKKIIFLCLALSSAQPVVARFKFPDWKGVQDLLPNNNKPEEVHPVLGKLYYPIISNLRLGDELYERNIESRADDEVRKTEYEAFAILLKELFPSGAGALRPNGSDSSIFGIYLTPKMIESIVRVLENQNGNLKDIFLKFYDDNKINNKKIKKMGTATENAEKIMNSFECLQKDGILPKNLLTLTFLTYFWKKFDKKEDLEDFLKGLNGTEEIKFKEEEKIETKEEIMAFLEGNDGSDFEKTARALDFGEEVLNPLAYSNDFQEDGQATSYQTVSFTNCAEESLFALLDLILYMKPENSVGNFFTQNIKKSPLKEFYDEKRGSQKGLDKRIESEWNNVVQNLELQEYQKGDKSKLYANKKDNFFYEIEPELLRFMHILKNISNYEKEVPKDGINLETEAKKWLEDFFKSIAPFNRIFSVEFEENSLQKNENKPDYSSVLNITMCDENNNELCKWKWGIDAVSHASINNLAISDYFKNEDYDQAKEAFELRFPILSLSSDNIFFNIFKDNYLPKQKQFDMFYKKNLSEFEKIISDQYIEDGFKDMQPLYENYEKNKNLDNDQLLLLAQYVYDDKFWEKNINEIVHKFDFKKEKAQTFPFVGCLKKYIFKHVIFEKEILTSDLFKALLKVLYGKSYEGFFEKNENTLTKWLEDQNILEEKLVESIIKNKKIPEEIKNKWTAIIKRKVISN